MPTLRSSSSGGNAGATALAVTFPAGLQAGDLLVVGITSVLGSTSPNVTAPSGWFSATYSPGSGTIAQSLAYKVATAADVVAGSATFTTPNVKSSYACISFVAGTFQTPDVFPWTPLFGSWADTSFANSSLNVSYNALTFPRQIKGTLVAWAGLATSGNTRTSTGYNNTFVSLTQGQSTGGSVTQRTTTALSYFVFGSNVGTVTSTTETWSGSAVSTAGTWFFVPDPPSITTQTAITQSNATLFATLQRQWLLDAVFRPLKFGSLQANAFLFPPSDWSDVRYGSSSVPDWSETVFGVTDIDVRSVIKRPGQSGSFAAAAFIPFQFRVNAIIRATRTGTTTLGALSKATFTKSFTASSYKRQVVYGGVTANAFKVFSVTTVSISVNLDAWVKSRLYDSFTVDATTIGKTKYGTFALDSERAKVGDKRGKLTVDAFFRGRMYNSFGAAAYVMDWHILRASAWIRPTFTADAFIKIIRTATMSAAAWKAAYLSAFALIKRPTPWPFVADATIARQNGTFPGKTKTFTTNAVVKTRGQEWFFWVVANILSPGKIKLNARIGSYIKVNCLIVNKTGAKGEIKADAYIRDVDFVVWPANGGPATDANGNPFPSWFNPTAREYRIQITINDVDVTGDVLWQETRFQQMAKTGAGTFELAFLGSQPYMGGEEVRLFIDGLPAYGGYVLMVERGYVFGSNAQPKTTLRGADYNILLDRLIVWNKIWTDENFATTGKNRGAYRYWKPFSKGTMDDVIIKKVAKDYMQWPDGFDLVTQIDPIATPAPVVPWSMPEAGTPLRQTLQSISQVTSGVFFIDAYRRLNYKDRFTATKNVPPLTDGLGGISSSAMTVVRDGSKLITDNYVWGTLANSTSGQITHSHHWYNSPQGQYGLWQYGEFRSDIFHSEWLAKRGNSIIQRYGKPIITASATVFEPGYQAGQVVQVISSQYGVNEPIVIREVDIAFAVVREPRNGNYYALPKYDLTLGMDPESPWNIYDYLPYPTETGTTSRLSTQGYPSFRQTEVTNAIDLLLVVDTTGSMWQYNTDIQRQFQSLVSKLSSLQGDIRVGLVTYGDRQDNEDANDWYNNYQLTTDYDAVYSAIGNWYQHSGGSSPDEQWVRTFWEILQGMTPVDSRPSARGFLSSPAVNWRSGVDRLIVWFGDRASFWGIEPNVVNQQTLIGVDDVIAVANQTGAKFYCFDVGNINLPYNQTVFNGVTYPNETNGGVRLANATGGVYAKGDYGWWNDPDWSWNVVSGALAGSQTGSDEFTRTVLDGWGTGGLGPWTKYYNSQDRATLSVNGSEGVWVSPYAHQAGYRVPVPEAGDFEFSGRYYAIAEEFSYVFLWLETLAGNNSVLNLPTSSYGGSGDPADWAVRLSVGGGEQDGGGELVKRTGWYQFKWKRVGRVNQAKVWYEADPEPDWTIIGNDEGQAYVRLLIEYYFAGTPGVNAGSGTMRFDYLRFDDGDDGSVATGGTGWGCDTLKVTQSRRAVLNYQAKAGTLTFYNAADGSFLIPNLDYDYDSTNNDGKHWLILKSGVTEVIACYLAITPRLRSRPTSPKNAGNQSTYRTGMLGPKSL